MLVKNAICKTPKFKLYPAISEEKDPKGTHLDIPPKVLLIHDVRTFYHFSIQELVHFEIDQAYNVLCENGALKPEHKHLEVKGLTHIHHMPRNFQMDQVLSRVQDMTFWLKKLIKITKKMIH